MINRTMRKTLILGAGGMLGFALMHWLSQQGRDVAATARVLPKNFPLPREIEILTGIDALRPTKSAAISNTRAKSDRTSRSW